MKSSVTHPLNLPEAKKPKFRSGALSFDFTIREAHKKGNKYPPPPPQAKKEL